MLPWLDSLLCGVTRHCRKAGALHAQHVGYCMRTTCTPPIYAPGFSNVTAIARNNSSSITMSWKASLSRHLPVIRFFACTESPASKGVLDWYKKNYQELKLLNPTMPLLLRTTENAFPAVTTELSWTTDDLLRYMLQHSLFRNENGTVAEDRVEAAKAYLETDWALLRRERWAHPGFDPEMPFLEKRHEEYRNWRENRPDLVQSLGLYLQHKDAMEQQMAVVRSGPNREYERAENALLMCQRVDLWCAGEPEVERAIRHLWALGKRVNRLEPDLPEFITEYYPGAKDL